MNVVSINGAGPPAAGFQLPIVDVVKWIGAQPPDREFLVDGWLARGTAALLVGEDGVGKSLMAQQLATCIATGRSFLGLDVVQAAALYITCEDDENELWRRQRAINQMIGVPVDAGPVILSSLVGYMGVELGYYDQRDTFQLSPVAQGIVTAAKDRRAGLIVLDNLAHLFPGNENVRRDVAVFCAALERIAIDANATVLMLAHPSKGGAEYSGSTGWSAHVRQRWFLERPDPNEGGSDRDTRILRKSKANYSVAGTEVECRWQDWAFIAPDTTRVGLYAGIQESAQAGVENEAFLRCLDAATERKRAVSHNQGVNYAPNIFARMPEGRGFKQEAFARAMERLLHLRKIEIDADLWQRSNRVWKRGIRRTDPAPSRAHQAAHTSAPSRPEQTSKHVENREESSAPTRTDPLHQAAAPSRCTDPHQPPSQVIENTCTDLHAPTPLYTTYISGAAAPAAPDDDDIDWGEPL